MQLLDSAASEYPSLVLDESESDFEDCVGTLGATEDWSKEQLEELKDLAKDVRWWQMHVMHTSSPAAFIMKSVH